MPVVVVDVVRPVAVADLRRYRGRGRGWVIALGTAVSGLGLGEALRLPELGATVLEPHLWDDHQELKS